MRHERLEARSALPIETRNDDDNPLAEATRAVEEMRTAFDQRMSGIDEINRRLDELETRNARPGATDNANDEETQRRALATFARNDDDTELRSLSVGSDPDGGFLVIPTLETGIRTIARDLDPIRSLASVITIATDSYEIIVDPSEIDAGWVGEKSERPATSGPKLEKIIIPVHEIYAAPRATQKFIDDANSDIGAWLEGRISDRFGRLEAASFVNGLGHNTPRGFMTYPTDAAEDFTRPWGAFQHIPVGHASEPTDKQLADALIKLSLKLRAPYRAGATWGMSREIAIRIRQLRDQNDHPLWQPGLQEGSPDRLLGYPVSYIDGMPPIGANALPVALASWPQAYQIVDRHGVRFVRDALTDKPYTLFYAYKRVGGGAVDFNALKFLKISTT